MVARLTPGIRKRVKRLRTGIPAPAPGGSYARGMIVTAHAADFVSLVFFVPVVAFLVWLGIDQVRTRRGARREGRGAGPDVPRADPDA